MLLLLLADRSLVGNFATCVGSPCTLLCIADIRWYSIRRHSREDLGARDLGISAAAVFSIDLRQIKHLLIIRSTDRETLRQLQQLVDEFCDSRRVETMQYMRESPRA